MRQRRPILYFVLAFGALYSLFALVPWPELPARYSSAYCYVGNALFGSYGDKGIVSFTQAERPTRSADTVVSTSLRGSRYIGDVTVSAWITAYLPTIEFIALALATPIAWRRRLMGLGIGTLIVQVILVLRVRIAILVWFSTPDTPWQLHHLGDSARRALAVTNEAINEAPVAAFVIPALVWLVLMFRPADWGGIFRFGGDDEHGATVDKKTSA
jgi:hypothetical protein